MIWRVIEGDSLDVMPSLGSGMADAIVTSPPYADQRHYDGSAARGTYHDLAARSNGALKNRSRLQRSRAAADAVDWLEPFLVAMAEVLGPRGSLMLNLGVVLRDGQDTDWGSEVVRRARSVGWLLLHRMVWHKPNPQTYSDPRFLSMAHEDVFWLALSTDVYRGYVDTEPGYDRSTRRPHKAATVRRIDDAADRPGDQRYAKRSRSHRLHPDGARPTTVITCGVGGQKGINHPAPMALGVAREIVPLCCPPDGVVLDPFCGSGTTGIACIDRSREFVGIEINAEYAAEARRRLTDHAPLLAPMEGAA